MGDISKHFDRREFACHCGCGYDTVDVELIRVLENLREVFEQPVIINSGTRCASHNTVIGGVPDSQHILGKAADIRVSHIDAKTVAHYLVKKYPDRYGIGRYSDFTHIDVRPDRSRW